MYIILAISDSNKHFQTALDEYRKRLGKTVTFVDMKPEKRGARQQIIVKESQLLLDKIAQYKNKGYRIALLAKEGDLLTTEALHDRYMHDDVVFVIGGPYGVDESLMGSMVDDYLAFGAHTMPHGLAKLVMTEQLYRIQTIEQRKTYHY